MILGYVLFDNDKIARGNGLAEGRARTIRTTKINQRTRLSIHGFLITVVRINE